jgi:pSer/pThr/pTyr-binding forkhead associated (FHA) protein
MPTLTLFFSPNFADDNWAGLSYQLDCPGGHKHGGEWILGRLPTSDLTINIRNVSRRHAAISYSYAADRWSVQDLSSSEGTFLNGKKLATGDLHPLRVGDRLYLSNNLINIVEDEHDTVGGDEGLPTIASTEPLDYRPAPAPAPDPEPQRTYADSAYLFAQWVVSGQSRAGKVYRLLVAAVGATAFIFMLDWLTN